MIDSETDARRPANARPMTPRATVQPTADSLFLTRHRDVEDELAASWLDGYNAALRDIASATVELNDAWRVVGRKTHDQRVRERLAESEAAAERFHAKWGTKPFAGTAVSRG